MTSVLPRAAADLEILVEGMFDGIRPHGPTAISLRDGRIVAVRARNEPAGDGMSVTDEAAPPTLAACYAIPGLIDSHVHVTGYREGIPAGRPYDAQKHFLRLCVAHGVTTVRDTGNSLEAIAHARAWGERYQGPHVVAAGPLLDDSPFMWPFSRLVATEDDARREVDRLDYEGVDFIKLYRNVLPRVARAVIEEAHDRGLKVAGDLSRTRVVDACRAGLDSVEHAVTLLSSVTNGTEGETHGDGLDVGCVCTYDSAGALARFGEVDPHGVAADQLAAAMLANGSTLVPTFLVTRLRAIFDEMVSDPNNRLMAAVMPYHRHFEHMRGAIGARIGRRFAGRYMPIRGLTRSETSAALDGVERMRALVRRLVGDGVQVVVGTDAPNPSITPGAALHRELEELCRAGLEPVEALRGATLRAAQLLGLDGTGVIKPGAHADLVLLDGDPTVDITATQRITAVILRGREVDRAALLDKVRAAAEDS